MIEEALDDLRRVEAQFGYSPRVSNYGLKPEDGFGSYAGVTLIVLFGGWNNALERAGLHPIPVRSTENE